MQVVTPHIAVLDAAHDQLLSRWVETNQSLDAHDPRIRDTFLPMIPIGGWVVDGGACLGSHATVYAERAAHVLAVEPSPRTAACLRYNVAHLPNIDVVEVALLDTDRTVWLVPNVVNAGATVVGEESDAGAIRVPTTTLDRLCGEWPRLDFVKLDVEGLVLRALEGARAVLTRWHPIVIAEVGDNLSLFGDSTERVIAFMRGLGYVCEPLPQFDDGGVWDVCFKWRHA